MAEEPQQMDIEAPAPAEVPKVHTPGEDSGLTTYPVALATQEAILEDQQLFTSMLQDLNAKLQNAQPKKYRPSKYRLPTGERWHRAQWLISVSGMAPLHLRMQLLPISTAACRAGRTRTIAIAPITCR